MVDETPVSVLPEAGAKSFLFSADDSHKKTMAFIGIGVLASLVFLWFAMQKGTQNLTGHN